jgi:hypothetical protein
MRSALKSAAAVVVLVREPRRPSAFCLCRRAVRVLARPEVLSGLLPVATRKRAYRASGGGLFSIADAPTHGERVGDGSLTRRVL